MQREVDRTMTYEAGHYSKEEELENRLSLLSEQMTQMDLRLTKEIERVRGEMKEEVKRETFKLIMLKQKHFGDTDDANRD